MINTKTAPLECVNKVCTVSYIPKMIAVKATSFATIH